MATGLMIFGAALSAVLALVLVTLLGRQQSPAVLVTVAIAAFAMPENRAFAR